MRNLLLLEVNDALKCRIYFVILMPSPAVSHPWHSVFREQEECLLDCVLKVEVHQ